MKRNGQLQRIQFNYPDICKPQSQIVLAAHVCHRAVQGDYRAEVFTKALDVILPNVGTLPSGFLANVTKAYSAVGHYSEALMHRAGDILTPHLKTFS